MALRDIVKTVLEIAVGVFTSALTNALLRLLGEDSDIIISVLSIIFGIIAGLIIWLVNNLRNKPYRYVCRKTSLSVNEEGFVVKNCITAELMSNNVDFLNASYFWTGNGEGGEPKLVEEESEGVQLFVPNHVPSVGKASQFYVYNEEMRQRGDFLKFSYVQSRKDPTHTMDPYFASTGLERRCKQLEISVTFAKGVGYKVGSVKGYESKRMLFGEKYRRIKARDLKLKEQLDGSMTWILAEPTPKHLYKYAIEWQWN